RPPAHPALHSFPTRRSSDLRDHEAGEGSVDEPETVIADDEEHAGEASNARGTECRNGQADAAIDRRHTAARGKVLKGIARVTCRSEEHTSELQSRENLVCRL